MKLLLLAIAFVTGYIFGYQHALPHLHEQLTQLLSPMLPFVK